jgi:hypothetical protein
VRETRQGRQSVPPYDLSQLSKRGMSRERGGAGDLEEDVFHDAAQYRSVQTSLAQQKRTNCDALRAIRTLELKLVALEQDVVEAPCLGGQSGRVSHLSLLNQESKMHSAHASVAGGPRFA